MSEIAKLLILGIVQGLTEFLPVSSSGHLVIIGKFLDFTEAGNMTEVVLHVGTFLAVIVYFWKRLISLAIGLFKGDRDALGYVAALAIGSVPVIVVYFAAGDFIESIFDEPVWAGAFLCVTGLIMLSLLRRPPETKSVSAGRGLAIGLAQAFALLPGISRSGSTIVLARHLGINRAQAAEFSFLLSLPAMAGAILIKGIGLLKGDEVIVPIPALIGLISSAVVGYLALLFLFSVIKKGKLWIFGVYSLLAGLISLFLLR